MAAITANEALPLVVPTRFQLFLRIGLTSFGGGLTGWLLREVVYAKRWLGEA